MIGPGLPHIPLSVSTLVPYLAIGPITLAIFAPLYYEMARGTISSDIPAHAEIIKKVVEVGRWPPHPGLHGLALVLLGFPSSLNWKSAILVLSGITLGALLVKHLLAATYLASWASFPSANHRESISASCTDAGPVGWRLVGLTMCLCLAGPIWSPEIGWQNFYLGKFSPNAWHNPTLLLSWPFIILHFAGLLQCLNQPNFKRLCQVLFYLAVATVIKPNYTVALCGALPITLLLKSFRSPAWIRAVILQLAVAVLVLLPQFAAFQAEENAVVVLAPFTIVSQRSGFIPLTFLTSVAFPLIVAITLRRGLLGNQAFQLAALLFLVAAAQCYLLVESGPGRSALHGNWYWGAHATLFLLFLVSLAALWRATFGEARRDFGIYACWGVFGLHVVTGVLWLTKHFIACSYY